MLKFRILVWIGLLLLLLTACGQSASVPVAESPAEEPIAASSQVSEAAPVAAVVDSAAEEGVAVQEEVDYCLECHTDKQMLIDTAKPEEEVIAENSGEG